MADLKTSMKIAASGLQAQNTRMRVIAQNVANAETTSETPGGDPYQRQQVYFKNVLDQNLGVELVKVSKVGPDKTPFKRSYEPAHPAADADGFVLKPNVNPLVETMDMREAQRSYEANLGVIEVSKSMLNRTLELMR